MLPLLLLLTATAHSQRVEFPAGGLDRHTLRIQTKAEGLYENGDFKRAHFIYARELAPIGDKYAQYMTGYMYLMGQGVAEDPVHASAWYRIAAERGVAEFVAVRDQLLLTLDAEQRAHSDALYVELRSTLSDIVVVMKSLENDLGKLHTETPGSRVAARSSPVTIVDPSSGTIVAADLYRHRLIRTLQTRLDYVTARLDIESLDADLSSAEVAALWDRITDYVAVVDDEADVFVATP